MFLLLFGVLLLFVVDVVVVAVINVGEVVVEGVADLESGSLAEDSEHRTYTTCVHAENDMTLNLSCGHATTELVVSVRQLVHPAVCPSVTFLKCERFLGGGPVGDEVL